MSRKSILSALLVLVFTLLATTESFAQFGGGFPGGSARGSRSRPDGGAREQRRAMQDNSPEQIEDRLGMLEEDLRLTAEQRTTWQLYVDRVRAYAADIGRERERGPMSSGQFNALAQIDRTVDTARNRLTALEDIAAATKSLYGSLTFQQKIVADPRLATIVSTIANPAPDRGGRPRTVP